MICFYKVPQRMKFKFYICHSLRKLLILVALLPLNLSAQIDLINVSLTDSSKSVIYIGVDNTIEVRGIPSDPNIKITASELRIEKSKWNENQYYCYASERGKDEIKIYRNDTLIFTKLFTIDRINDPIVYFGDLTDTIATVKEVLRNPLLHVEIPNCYYDHGFRIFEFEVGFFIKSLGDTVITGRTNGFKLLKEHLKIIEQLEAGEKIIFSRMKATCNDCITRSFKPFSITIR